MLIGYEAKVRIIHVGKNPRHKKGRNKFSPSPN